MRFIKKCWNCCWEIYHKYEEIFNYLIVGAIGVLISIVSYSLCRYLSFSIITSNVISWIISVLAMYILNKTCVFKTKNLSKKALFKEFFSFVIARIFTLFIETGILYLGVILLHINDIIIKIIGQVIIIVLNYILSKLIIFSKKV